MYRVRVGELPATERPRERLRRLGPGALKSEELLAILLRTGTAREDVLALAGLLLHARGGLRGLAATDLVTLAGTHGVGPAKASTIAAAFELGRRAAVEEGAERPTVTGPTDIARLLHAEMELLQQEELRLLILDTKHHVLSAPVLYRGTVSAAGGRVAEVFREAVRLNASKIALAHNHPSGDPAPSSDDVEFTRAVTEAGALLDLPVLDHLVLGHGPGRWVSMRERRLGFD
ncbi:MAG: DNA repair protein RadC [Dehalococcoidia bacterium]